MENLEYLKILYTLAWSDNEIQEEEILLLNDITEKLDLENTSEIEYWKTNKLDFSDIKDINFEKWEIEERRHVLFLAIIIAESDGIYKDEEKIFIKELSKLLNLETVTKENLLKDIEESNRLFS